MKASSATLTTPDIFDRYERVRSRFDFYKPVDKPKIQTRGIEKLTDIQDQASAFVFDAFGVLNVGDTLIPGADRRVDELRALGNQIRILTNAASYPRSGAIDKFKKLGISLFDDEIITSRDATLLYMTSKFEPNFSVWGCIAAPEDDLSDVNYKTIKLADAQSDYDQADGFLFLSTSSWTDRQQAILLKSLKQKQRPVLIANADLVAPRDEGFSIEPGWYGHALVDAGIATVEFFGKPFPEIYDLAEKSLAGISPSKIVMCGDTLHTDILGAAARGWQTAFITRDGLFAGHKADEFCERSNLHPNWQLARI